MKRGQILKRGFSLVELLLALTILGILLGLFTIELVNIGRSNGFEKSFTIQVKDEFNDEEISIAQPIVTKRLSELRASLKTAQDLKAGLLLLPPANNPEEANQRIQQLREINRIIGSR